MKAIEMTQNIFEPINNNKTLYRLMYGTPIVDKMIFVTTPEYLHSKSPAFVITAAGRQICTMASIGEGFFIGGFKDGSILAHMTDAKLELFNVNLETEEVEANLKASKLTEAMAEARKNASKILNLNIIHPRRKKSR